MSRQRAEEGKSDSEEDLETGSESSSASEEDDDGENLSNLLSSLIFR